MQILYSSRDEIEMKQFGIDIPIGFDNSRKTVDELLARWKAAGGAQEPLPGWFHDDPGPAPSRADLEAVHCPSYIGRLLDDETTLEKEVLRTFELVDEKGGFNRYDPDAAVRPLSNLFTMLLNRGAGTLRAAELALKHGEAWYFGGGFHHAHYDYGSGFCFYHDVLTARQSLGSGTDLPLTWVIDIDAHKGDGTSDLAARMRRNGDSGVLTLSIHMASGWPLDMQRQVPGYDHDPAWVPSDIDIPVESGEEDRYNARLSGGLLALEDMSWKLWGRKLPELVFVLAGADPFEEDELPSATLLQLSREQMLQRNMLVRDFMLERHLPAAWLQAGNYGNNAWKTYLDFLIPALGLE